MLPYAGPPQSKFKSHSCRSQHRFAVGLLAMGYVPSSLSLKLLRFSNSQNQCLDKTHTCVCSEFHCPKWTTISITIGVRTNRKENAAEMKQQKKGIQVAQMILLQQRSTSILVPNLLDDGDQKAYQFKIAQIQLTIWIKLIQFCTFVRIRSKLCGASTKLSGNR